MDIFCFINIGDIIMTEGGKGCYHNAYYYGIMTTEMQSCDSMKDTFTNNLETELLFVVK